MRWCFLHPAYIALPPSSVTDGIISRSRDTQHPHQGVSAGMAKLPVCKLHSLLHPLFVAGASHPPRCLPNSAFSPVLHVAPLLQFIPFHPGRAPPRRTPPGRRSPFRLQPGDAESSKPWRRTPQFEPNLPWRNPHDLWGTFS